MENRKKRKCLCCGRMFVSFDSMNRICRKCKKSHRLHFGSVSFQANFRECIYYEDIPESEDENEEKKKRG